MLDSPMIDVVLGLILFFLVMSIPVTAIQGWISSVFKLKGRNLKEGIENLVGKNITENIYDHPLMKTMGTKTFFILIPFQKVIHLIYQVIYKLKGEEFKKVKATPSHLKSKYFFKIFFDIIDPDKKLLQKERIDIEELVKEIPEESSQVKKVIQSLYIKTDNKIEDFEKEISEWFESGMERASGWYKRKMQLCSFIISFVLVIILNANAITIAETLWQNDELRSNIATVGIQASKEDYNNLQKQFGELSSEFPIGWKNKDENKDNVNVKNEKHSFLETIKERFCNLTWLDILGWFITISAISLGAPFWFDLLKKVANLRKPKTPQKP